MEAIRKVWTGEKAKGRGIVYLEEGEEEFEVDVNDDDNDGKGEVKVKFKVYASAWTPEFCNWGFAYKRDVDRFNNPPSSALMNQNTKVPTNPVPDFPSVDIMITHGPPQGIFDAVPNRLHRNEQDGLQFQNTGCTHLLRAVERAKPRLHVFGHIHEGWGCGVMHWPSPELPPSGGKFFVALGQGRKEGDIDKKIRLVDDDDDDAKEAVRVDAKDLEFGNQTLFVNASMLDERYRGVNKAWVVEINLPRA